jgi:hypothetical protein
VSAYDRLLSGEQDWENQVEDLTERLRQAERERDTLLATLGQLRPAGISTDRQHRTAEELREALGRMCEAVWCRTRGSALPTVFTIPVDHERDADCILADGITELLALRERVEATERELAVEIEARLQAWRELLGLREDAEAIRQHLNCIPDTSQAQEREPLPGRVYDAVRDLRAALARATAAEAETARLRAALEKAKRLALHEVWCDSRLKMDRDGVWRDRPCNCTTREYIADIDAALAAKEEPRAE